MFPQLSQFDLHHRIAENPAPTIVFFSSEGCSSCRHLREILEQLRHLHPEWPVYQVDALAEMGLVREFEIFHLPAVFLFLQGIFHSEISCAASPSAIETAVGAAMLVPPREAP
jgi:thioredoxin-like negative regulator of GroEL